MPSYIDPKITFKEVRDPKEPDPHKYILLDIFYREKWVGSRRTLKQAQDYINWLILD